MTDAKTADYAGNISREQAENAFRDALRLFVGRGRKHKASMLATGSGVPLRLIDCYRGYPVGHPDHRPLHFGHKVSITAFLGAEFTSEWLKLADQAAFDLPEEEPDPGELAADNSDDSAKVVRAAVDGRFDRDERGDLKVVGARMMTRGAQLVAIGAAA